MTWFQRETVGPGITRLWEPEVHRFFRGNIFHVRGRRADLVFDFGLGLQPLRPALELTPGHPVIAIASHAHADHVGGFHEFPERLGHEAESEAFATMPDSETLAHRFRESEVPVSTLPVPGWDIYAYRLLAAPLTRTVEEGQVIDLGDRCFVALHLPGHSPGSIGLLDRAGGRLLAGDAIYAGQIVDDLPHSNRGAYRETMRRLAALEVAEVHGGHNATLSGAEMRSIAESYLACG
ncbi:MBL fold metallo-hydrolase [Rubellimicrobium arenae]|uniref:MBL fold metallo-hydrolase n=1 Tax=Rubellimicrobium arenae TaxID=2817372 RepID=UPI001B3036F0|nr:MBL fold metallo-hydrolase [Rubellimicrobium arenae]